MAFQILVTVAAIIIGSGLWYWMLKCEPEKSVTDMKIEYRNRLMAVGRRMVQENESLAEIETTFEEVLQETRNLHFEAVDKDWET